MSQTHSQHRLDDETMFQLLTSPRRRLALHALNEEGPLLLDELAVLVASYEYTKTTDAVTSQERQRIFISLYQNHLTKLQDAGVVDWDDEGLVKLDQADRLLWYIYNGPSDSLQQRMDDLLR